MTLSFAARYVSCADAIDGEILQVSFDTMPDSGDEDERKTPYVLISRYFEFSDPATIEWHDGSDYDGGAEILSLTLTRNRMRIRLDRDLAIDVTFMLSSARFKQLERYLRQMLTDEAFALENTEQDGALQPATRPASQADDDSNPK